MPLVSLGEAARLTGHGKSTIARSIKAGRLSASRTDVGSYEIDTSELFRVYPFKPAATPTGETPDTGADTGATAQHATPDAVAEVTAQVAALREVAALLRSQLEDIREDRDQWRTQAQRLALPPPESATRSWWWKRRTS